MRRFTSLLALFVLFVTNAAAQFIPTTFKDEGFDLTKLYNLKCVRGCLQVTAEGWKVLDQDQQNLDDQYQTVQFVPKPDTGDSIVYLYSPTNAKYLDRDNNWVSTMAEADRIYLFKTDYTKTITDADGNITDIVKYPYGLSFSPDYSTKNLMVTGSWNVESDPAWTTPDDGDAFQITPSNLTPDDIDVLSSLIENANNEIYSYGLLPTLYAQEDIDKALDEVAVAESEGDITTALKTLKKAANGKTITLHTLPVTDVRPIGYLRDNGANLVVDSLSFESGFQLEYNDSADRYTVKNIYTGRYIQDVAKSTAIQTGEKPCYFKIAPYGGDDQENDLTCISQTDPASNIHNGNTTVLGWYDTETASRWKLAPFNANEAAQKIITNLDSKTGNHWGDYEDNDAFKALKNALETNPSIENYNALLASNEVVSGNAFFNIHSAYKNEADSVDYTHYSIALSQFSNQNINDSTYQHIQAFEKDLEDPFQIWKVISVKQGYVRLYSPQAKKYIGGNATYTENTVALSDEPVDWKITWVNDSTFQLNNDNDNLNFENNETYFGNLNKWHGRDQWIFNEVKTLPITASVYGDKAYTTACYPFDLTLDKGTAYRAKVADDGNKLNLVEVGSTIPAGTPVIIETAAADRDITATINGLETSAEINEPFWIQGTYFPVTATDSTDILVFGQKDNVPGFYHFNRIVMNGAYLPYSGTLDGLTLGDVVDAIEKLHVDAIPADAPRYNLAGQRVGKDYKGVVIVNGKKFIQK